MLIAANEHPSILLAGDAPYCTTRFARLRVGRYLLRMHP
jgi:hypothetical protein